MKRARAVRKSRETVRRDGEEAMQGARLQQGVCVEMGAVDAAGAAANEAGVMWWWQWSSSGCVCMQRTEGEGRVGGRCVTMRRCLQQVCSSSRAWAWWSRSQGGPPGRALRQNSPLGRGPGRQRGAGGGACNQQSSRSPPARHMGNGARDSADCAQRRVITMVYEWVPLYTST